MILVAVGSEIESGYMKLCWLDEGGEWGYVAVEGGCKGVVWMMVRFVGGRWGEEKVVVSCTENSWVLKKN